MIRFIAALSCFAAMVALAPFAWLYGLAVVRFARLSHDKPRPMDPDVLCMDPKP